MPRRLIQTDLALIEDKMQKTYEEVPRTKSGKIKSCVELFVFDNDGPEGYCERTFWDRSSEAVEHILGKYGSEIENYNYTITNHWKIKVIDHETGKEIEE